MRCDAWGLWGSQESGCTVLAALAAGHPEAQKKMAAAGGADAATAAFRAHVGRNPGVVAAAVRTIAAISESPEGCQVVSEKGGVEATLQARRRAADAVAGCSAGAVGHAPPQELESLRGRPSWGALEGVASCGRLG